MHALELDGDEWARAGWLLEYTTQVATGLGFGRIVAPGTEAPNLLANLV